MPEMIFKYTLKGHFARFTGKREFAYLVIRQGAKLCQLKIATGVPVGAVKLDVYYVIFDDCIPGTGITMIIKPPVIIVVFFFFFFLLCFDFCLLLRERAVIC